MTNNDNLSDDKKLIKSVLVQLKHFYNRSCAIHFNTTWGDWRNAIIREINEKEETVVLKEFVLGNIEVKFEDINPNSIEEYNLIKKGGIN